MNTELNMSECVTPAKAGVQLINKLDARRSLPSNGGVGGGHDDLIDVP